MNWLGRYLWNWLKLLDQALNTATGGDPRERVSSRAGKALLKGAAWACVLCRVLDWLQKDHCLLSIDSTVGDEAVLED